MKIPYAEFPPVEEAKEDGLLAIGGELTVKRILDAYYKGIFPWYDSSQPVLWWSPNPRMVLFPENLKISRSMEQSLRKEEFQVTFNQDFEKIIENCQKIKRSGQKGTWITPALKDVFIKLHHLGMAKSVEVWKDKELVGGLYGLFLQDKKVFCGESMFASVSNASKFGFIKWVQKLKKEQIRLIDCQVYTEHLESLGAEEISRKEFLKFLK